MKNSLYFKQVGNRHKTPLVLLHPLWVSNTYFDPLIAQLSDHFFITAFDLPGFANSEKATTNYSIENIADLIKSSLKELGINQPILFGSSLGAVAALAIAADHSMKTKALIVHAPPWKSDAIHLNMAKYMLSILGKSDFAIDRTQQMVSKSSMKSFLLSLANLFKPNLYKLEKNHQLLSDSLKNLDLKACNEVWDSLQHFDGTSYAKEINTPTLILISRSDKTVTPKSAVALSKIIKKSSLKVLSEGSHALIIEKPSIIAELLLAFCKEHHII